MEATRASARSSRGRPAAPLRTAATRCAARRAPPRSRRSASPTPSGRAWRRDRGAGRQGGEPRWLRAGFWQSPFGGGDKSAAPAPPAKGEDVAPPFCPELLLRGTFLEGRQLARAYVASRDGWSARAFHEHCDMIGPCVVVAETAAGRRFGGFSPIAWMSSDDYTEKVEDFLFLWAPGEDEPARIPKVGGMGPLFDWARGGPQWGSDALVIGPPLSPAGGGISGPGAEDTGIGDLRTVKSRLGIAYALTEQGEDSLVGAERTAELVEVEVYYAPEIAALYATN